jgi:hypothetical protein
MAENVLGEDRVEGPIGQRQGTRRHQLERHPLGQPGVFYEAGGLMHGVRLDVDPEHPGGA